MKEEIKRYFQLEKELIETIRKKETEKYILVSNNMEILKNVILSEIEK